MSIRVYGAEQNPAIDDFLYRCSDSSGASTIATGRGRAIIDGEGRNAVQLLAGADTCADALTKESIGLSALIPFARVLNPMLMPQKLHYEIPHANDLGMRRHGLFRRTNEEGKSELVTRRLHVSGRLASEVKRLERIFPPASQVTATA